MGTPHPEPHVSVYGGKWDTGRVKINYRVSYPSQSPIILLIVMDGLEGLLAECQELCHGIRGLTNSGVLWLTLDID